MTQMSGWNVPTFSSASLPFLTNAVVQHDRYDRFGIIGIIGCGGRLAVDLHTWFGE